MKQECNPGGSGGSNLRWVARNDSLPSSSGGSVDITIAELKNFKELQICVSYFDGRVLESPLIRRIEGVTLYQEIVFGYYGGDYISVYFALDTTTGKLTFRHYRSNGSATTTFAGYFIAT